jgi:hypothetical protein
MNNEQFDREVNYQTSVSILKTMLKNEIISKQDYRKANQILIKKYDPILGGLCP